MKLLTSAYRPVSRRRSLPCSTARERIMRRAGPGGTPARFAIVRIARPVLPSGWLRITARIRGVPPGIVTVTTMLQPARRPGSLTSPLLRNADFKGSVRDDGHLGQVLET